ncbi:2-oxoglutarate oxidoreductase subunit KorB [Poriferisphaera corsica]|uniref:2-oxoglutarate oxidoreductase subunit KorB n=1 Tax=Poriferisphaera corsica TaxID=2528020 RepID=A0A517YV45_9BACT|nr:2-oxoacid:ferredoxin oxidoreductase subunit beta [Poriferisphaera corsica]QDU34085.1 2-oxoglutarate oxidoreductase subunit KorB [Poriferisphaera corsica]
MNQPLTVLKPKDFASDQDVRWCPGCGDYAILNQVKRVLAKIQAKKENTVFVAGIGCSSRFPYYMGTYGIHSIHGRAPAIATGVKITNPELDVWVVTGDGDALSIGGNHLMHVLRRNVNLKILLFNNRIYGLTKGQYSPTSEIGKRSPSSPMGSIDPPLTPISIALAAEASFVARAIDVDKSLSEVLERAAKHEGSAFVEIYQDCNVFNHGAYSYATDKQTKEDSVIRLTHGEPILFGKERDKGIMFTDAKPEVVTIGKGGITLSDIAVHDETDASLAYALGRFKQPDFPEPVGIFRSVEGNHYEDLLAKQITDAQDHRGIGTLDDLFNTGDTYEITEIDSKHHLHD